MRFAAVTKAIVILLLLVGAFAVNPEKMKMSILSMDDRIESRGRHASRDGPAHLKTAFSRRYLEPNDCTTIFGGSCITADEGSKFCPRGEGYNVAYGRPLFCESKEGKEERCCSQYLDPLAYSEGYCEGFLGGRCEAKAPAGYAVATELFTCDSKRSCWVPRPAIDDGKRGKRKSVDVSRHKKHASERKSNKPETIEPPRTECLDPVTILGFSHATDRSWGSYPPNFEETSEKPAWGYLRASCADDPMYDGDLADPSCPIEGVFILAISEDILIPVITADESKYPRAKTTAEPKPEDRERKRPPPETFKVSEDPKRGHLSEKMGAYWKGSDLVGYSKTEKATRGKLYFRALFPAIDDQRLRLRERLFFRVVRAWQGWDGSEQRHVVACITVRCVEHCMGHPKRYEPFNIDDPKNGVLWVEGGQWRTCKNMLIEKVGKKKATKDKPTSVELNIFFEGHIPLTWFDLWTPVDGGWSKASTEHKDKVTFLKRQDDISSAANV